MIERVHNVNSACAKKRPPVDEGQGTPVKRGRPKGTSLLNHYPPLPEGINDDASNQRNITALQRQRPRKDVVLSLLNLTFATRREKIVSDSADVTLTSILTKYKAFTLPYAVCICTCMCSVVYVYLWQI